MPKRTGGSVKRPKSRQAASYSGQKAASPRPKTVTVAGKGYSITKARSQGATPSPAKTGGPSPRYVAAARRSRGTNVGVGNSSAAKPAPKGKTGDTQPPKPGDKAPTPNKYTKKEQQMVKKYTKLKESAFTTINGKTMTKSQRQKIVDDREKLRKLRGKLVGKGYGKLAKKPNKSGRRGAVGILKALQKGEKVK